MKLENRTVVVTGGSSGIGLAVARALAGRGCRTVLCGRDPDALSRAAAEVPHSVAVRADLSTPEGRQHLVSVVRSEYAEASILVNCAGIMRDDRMSPEDLDGAREQAEVNLLAPVELTLCLLDHLGRDADGAVVNITSGVAYVPIGRTAVYSATKAALHSFTLSLRGRVRDRGVRVFELVPTAVDTPMMSGIETPKISADEVARALLTGMESDREEIRVGQASLLVAMSRLAPRFILRKLNPQPSRTVGDRTPGGAVDASS
jgi:uncharacterized oxidoreductase